MKISPNNKTGHHCDTNAGMLMQVGLRIGWPVTKGRNVLTLALPQGSRGMTVKVFTPAPAK